MKLPLGFAPRLAAATLALFITATVVRADDSQTERRYLSGHGPKDAVPWEFSVTGGHRAGEQTTIPVPSNWELQGFGTYNYGQELNKGSEHGLYRLQFNLPAEWKGRRIRLVFDGVMTDAAVKLNGRVAGPVHQGGFYRFRYDVTSFVKLGDGPEQANLLEVDVAKVSADPQTELAERGGDYWVFGGIFRPVWVEASPAQSIEHVAIDARADGSLTADVTLGSMPANPRPDGPTLLAEHIEAEVLDAAGVPVGVPSTEKLPAGGTGRVRIALRVDSPKLWTAETPQLYTLRLSRLRGKDVLHAMRQRFGFRTFEVREGEGLYLNGQRILLKGVDRHSFRPETGRALNREDCYEDVRVIRSMNMNAVRMSHYPPDEAFLEACDELGLYVLDEISGWQKAHGTPIGRLLVREMVERDVNHPSILFWDNGNEGGFNRDLDGEFSLYDPQNRRVLHPWDPFNGVDTKHYVSYDDWIRRLHGPNLVMPTEILHAIYDGGGGSGLEDYWRALVASPVGAGLFIWDFADEGVVRTDQGGRIDVHSTFAPDGIIGPHFEKEGSYYAIRDIWSPVQIEAPKLDEKFDGTLTVHNRFDFTSLAACRFAWKLVRFDAAASTLAEGAATAPAVAAHADGQLALALPANWREADSLALTVSDPAGTELWTWTWATPALAKRAVPTVTANSTVTPALESSPAELRLRAGDVMASFDATTGLLRALQRGNKVLPLGDGPRLAFARPPSNNPAATTWLPLVETDAVALTRHVATPATASVVEVEVDNLHGAPAFAGFKLELSPDGATWSTIFDASRRQQDGTRYEFPPQMVAAVRLSNVYRFDGQAPAVKTFRVGYAPARFPEKVVTPAAITQGTDRDPKTGAVVPWIEVRGGPSGLEHARWSMMGGGLLRLDYAYALEGEFAYYGISFACAREKTASFRWLGEGPYRVWQNRLRGTWLGVHETARHDLQPGESWVYPEFEGYFAGVRWARLATDAGAITVYNPDPSSYVRVGTPRISHVSTTPDFPSGDLSFLQAIPAMGSKGKPAEGAGPHSQWAKATGRYSGTLVFGVGE